MKIIRELIDNMEQELDLAKLYAQRSILYNSEANEYMSKRFQIMAYDCLTHADTMHSVASELLNELALPQKTQDKWVTFQEKYIKNYAWIKHFLQL